VILYSIVPAEVVFENKDLNYGLLKEIDYLGEKVIVMPIENNQYKISRVISTSPQAFLDPKLQPGSIIGDLT
jgi:hypothetical protein